MTGGDQSPCRDRRFLRWFVVTPRSTPVEKTRRGSVWACIYGGVQEPLAEVFLGRCMAKVLENWFWCRTDVINPLHPFSPFPHNSSHLVNTFVFSHSFCSLIEFFAAYGARCISCIHPIKGFFPKIIHSLTNLSSIFFPLNTVTFFTTDVHKVVPEIKFRICRKGNKDAPASWTFFLTYQYILSYSTDFEVQALLENQFQKFIWLQLHRTETIKLVELCNIGMLYWAGALLGCLLCSHTAQRYSGVVKGS